MAKLDRPGPKLDDPGASWGSTGAPWRSFSSTKSLKNRSTGVHALIFLLEVAPRRLRRTIWSDLSWISDPTRDRFGAPRASFWGLLSINFSSFEKRFGKRFGADLRVTFEHRHTDTESDREVEREKERHTDRDKRDRQRKSDPYTSILVYIVRVFPRGVFLRTEEVALSPVRFCARTHLN